MKTVNTEPSNLLIFFFAFIGNIMMIHLSLTVPNPNPRSYWREHNSKKRAANRTVL